MGGSSSPEIKTEGCARVRQAVAMCECVRCRNIQKLNFRKDLSVSTPGGELRVQVGGDREGPEAYMSVW